jgi:putative oxidoreductase
MEMSTVPTRWRDAAPYVLSALRIAAAFLFLQFGTAKWFAFPGSIVPGGGTVSLGSLVGFGAILEVVGGTLMLIGLFTRPVAFVLSGS